MFVFNYLTAMLKIFEEFIDHYFEGKTGSERQARAALKHWENHTGQDPYQVDPKDVDHFVYEKLEAPKKKDRLKPRTLSLYLLYIAKFYEWLGLGQRDSARYTMLAKYTMEKSRRLTKQIDEPSRIDLQEVVRMLMKITELQGKLLVRLLVFSKIPIGCLNGLRVGHIYNVRDYEVDCKGKTIRGVLYSDTPEIVNAIRKERKLGTDDRLIDVSVRQIEYLVPRYAKKVGITKSVTPKDLKEFGKNPRLRKWLIEEYEKAITRT